MKRKVCKFLQNNTISTFHIRLILSHVLCLTSQQSDQCIFHWSDAKPCKGLFTLDAQTSLWGVKHDALVLEHMIINRSVQTDRSALWFLYNGDADYRARKSRVYIAWRYEIHAIIGSLGTVRAQPRFRSHVKSMGDFRLLQLTVI